MPVLCPGCLAWLSRGPGQCLWWGPVWLLDLTKGLAVAPGAAPPTRCPSAGAGIVLVPTRNQVQRLGQNKGCGAWLCKGQS